MKKYLSGLLVLALVPALAGARTTTTQNTAASQQARPPSDCGCDPGSPADVLATVNGAKITRELVDAEVKDRIAELRNQIADARNRELENQLKRRLLNLEAAKRGITMDQLEQQIVATVKEPTDAEAQNYYVQNKANIQGEYSEWKPSIIAYIRDQRRQELMTRFALGLRASYQVKVLVTSVTPPKNDAERGRILATVMTKPITSGDIEDALRS